MTLGCKVFPERNLYFKEDGPNKGGVPRNRNNPPFLQN